MSSNQVTVVRVYLPDGDAQLKSLLTRLRNWEKLRGVTVFRGISGFGDSGVIHGADIIDLSMNLPLVVEFFDEPEKIEVIVEHLNEIIKPGHIVTWSANVNG